MSMTGVKKMPLVPKFRECLLLGQLISNIVMIQKLQTSLEQLGLKGTTLV